LLRRSINQFQNDDIEILLKVLLNGMVIFEPLLYLAIITQPHENLTGMPLQKRMGTLLFVPIHKIVSSFRGLMTYRRSALHP